MAIRVNMFRWRLTSEAQPRSKNGQPPQRTTGEANASCARLSRRAEKACWSGCPGIMSDIARRKTGSVKARHTQNRRVIKTNSGFASSAAATVRGSKAMPQMGQNPGPSRTTSGCIGQV